MKHRAGRGAVRSMRRGRRSTGDYPPDRPPRSPAHHTEGGNHCIRLVGDRSVMFTHLRSARLRSLHSDSLHITSLVFRGCPVGTMTPLACRAAPAPAAAPARFSHHAPHRVRRCVLSKCITLSDSVARRIRGSDSPLMRLVTFAP